MMKPVTAEMNEGAYRALFRLVVRMKHITSPPNPKMMLLRYTVKLQSGQSYLS